MQVPTSESNISGGVAGVIMPWASSIDITNRISDEVGEIEVTPLLTTFETAGVDLEFEDLSPRSPRLVELADSPLRERHLAVAVTGTRCPPLHATCEIDPENVFRMIVATDSDWIGEQMVQRYSQHQLLALNWMDWLMQEDALATIRGKGEVFRPLVFTSDTHKNIVQYANVIGVPALIVLLGLARFLVRRNRTRKVYGSGK